MNTYTNELSKLNRLIGRQRALLNLLIHRAEQLCAAAQPTDNGLEKIVDAFDLDQIKDAIGMAAAPE